MASDLNQKICKQRDEMTRRTDVICVRLETGLQRAQCAQPPLQSNMDRVMAMDLKSNDVSEVYSLFLVAKFAKQLGLAEGWGLDFTIEESGK